jgi:hypothetical protein
VAPLTEDEHTVLFSLVSAIVDSGDPNAGRMFYPNDHEWHQVQSLIRKGLAQEIRQPGGNYFVGFGLDPESLPRSPEIGPPSPFRGLAGIEVGVTDAGIRLHERGGQNRGSAAAGYTLGDLAKVKKDMRKADFWLTADGQPTRTFKKNYIGIKIQRTDILIPDYAYYMLMHLANQGVWFKPLTVEQVRSLPLQTAK